MVKKITFSIFLFFILATSGTRLRAQNAPIITSTPMGYPSVTVAENTTFNYAIAASDPNDDALTFTKVSGPSWLSLTTNAPSAVAFGSLPAATYQGVVADNAGNTYVAVQNGVSIYKITPDGTTTVFKTGRPSGTIYNLAVNDHYLYILNYGNNYISRIDLNDPTFAETTVLTGYSSPYGAAFRDGFMYVSSSSANKVIKVALSSLPATYDAGTMDYIVSGLSIPDGMDFDRNGNLYIANKGLGKVSMHNGTTLSNYITGIGPNNDVKFDRAGNFYIALQGASGSIVKYAAGTTTSPVTVPSGTGFIWAMNINPAGTLVFVQGNLTYKYETGAVLSGTPTHAEVGGPYSVTLRVDDGNGNTVDQSFTITVIDPNPPTVSTYNPANNTTNIAVDANLSISFNEDVKKGTGYIRIKKSSDNSLLEQIDVTGSRVSISGTTVIIDPALYLPGLTDVYVEVDATAFLDLFDNAYVGISNGSTWKFQTVQKNDQTITFASTASATYGDADFDPGATSSNTSIPITYTSSDLSVATIVAGRVHILRKGTTIITASQAEDATYNAAADKTQTLTINAKPITVSLNSSPTITKVYDGNASATLVADNYTLNGIEGSDVVSVSGTATYDNKNAGTGKTITGDAFALAGAQKDNYSLSTISATTTGAITAKPITLILNVSPSITKVYDGNASTTLVADNYTLNGIEGSDVVSVSGTAAYDNKNAGTGKTITVDAFALAGAQKDNYSLSTISATTTGAITAKPITLTLNVSPSITKIYDGNTSATLAAHNYTLNGIEGSDVVSVSGTAAYDNKNAGTGKTVTANGFVLAGAQKDNYSLTTTSASVTSTIDKKVLTVTADNKTKFLEAANPILTLSYSGFINGEGISELSTTPLATTTADASSPAGTYPITASGGSAVNYSFNYLAGELIVIPGSPTDISLVAATVYENQAPNTRLATFSSTSADPNATFTYSLVSGDGSTDNGLFLIVGNELRTAASLDYEQKSSYSIRVRSTTQQGMSLEKQFTVNIQDVNEAPTLALINDQTLCYTSALQSISLSGISAGPETSQSVSVSAGSNNPNLFDQFYISSNSLNYRIREGQTGTAAITITVRDNGGTANGGTDTFSRSFNLTVNSLPQVSIGTDKGVVEISKGEILVLSATGGSSYSWANSPGILNGNGTPSLTVRPSETTTYRVTVFNAAGCSVQQDITVIVNADYLAVSGINILSPNGDGINDKLVIRNLDMYSDNEVKIFDGAGRLIFSQKNYTNQWDGKFNGSPLAEGTYYYTVDFGKGMGKLKGFVSIIND